MTADCAEARLAADNALSAELRDKIRWEENSVDMPTLSCVPKDLTEVCLALRDTPELAYTQLSDLCGVDYSTYGESDWQTTETTSSGFSRGVQAGALHEDVEQRPRYAVVYHLLSMKNVQRLRLRCAPTGEPPRLESVTPIWASADWYEREAFDLFGILFEGHTDLRRLLTDYGFSGHPFRKDFPLIGEVEVRYDPEQQRVIYQPVTIENRVLVPRVIRHDNRYLHTESSEQTPSPE